MEPAPDDDRPVVVETVNQRMFIYLNRPAALNAQNQPMRDGIVAALDRLDREDDLRVGIFVGIGGRAFSAGADLNEVRSGGPRPRPRPEQQRTEWSHFEAARWAAKPLIAAIDGHCVGGGLELANYCDIRLATEASSFGQPEPRTVRNSGGPGLHQVTRAMPLGEAMLMLLTSRPMPARRAYEIGLIQRLCADRGALMAEVDVIVGQMLECDPIAQKVSKRVGRWGADMSAEQAEKLHLLADEIRWDVTSPSDPRAK